MRGGLIPRHAWSRILTHRSAQAKKPLSSNEELLAFQGAERRFNLTISPYSKAN